VTFRVDVERLLSTYKNYFLTFTINFKNKIHKMRKTLILLLILFSTHTFAQNYISDTLLGKTRLIKFNDAVATGFLLSIDYVDYLITVRHLFKDSTINSGSEVNIEALKNNIWIKYRLPIFYHSNKNVDIAVLKIGTKAIDNFGIGANTNFKLSRDCYFIGYPLGLVMTKSTNSGFPFPFIKKGIVSAKVDDYNGVKTIFLDAHNNQGFSGSPLITFIDNKPSIIGIVCGYLKEDINTNNLILGLNSGILYGHEFSYVLEILNQK
jgi:S1-C subfamily serine protease